MNAHLAHRPVTPGVAGSSPVHSAKLESKTDLRVRFAFVLRVLECQGVRRADMALRMRIEFTFSNARRSGAVAARQLQLMVVPSAGGVSIHTWNSTGSPATRTGQVPARWPPTLVCDQNKPSTDRVASPNHASECRRVRRHLVHHAEQGSKQTQVRWPH
jgi:hypothetical protein